MNANATMIVKRNGTKEPLNIDKIHKVVIHACEGLAGVSASQIEMNANLQFYDGMTTEEIQEILIRSANDLISLEAPNYQYAAARLLSYGINKQVFGEYQPISLKEMIIKNIERGVYDPGILQSYDYSEIESLGAYIKHKRDENFIRAGLRLLLTNILCRIDQRRNLFEIPVYVHDDCGNIVCKLSKRR